MNRHRELPAWQEAGEIISLVYTVTRELPAEERFVAVTQMRRAAWSVQNNIAEGYAKLGRREMRRFFDAALASLAEVDSMTAKLLELYPIEAAPLQRLDVLRGSVTRGLFAILKRRP